MSFQTQITGYVAESTGGDTINYSATEVTQWLTEGAKVLLSRMPRRMLWNAATTKTFSTSGTPITTGQILEVSRNDGDYQYPCREVSSARRGMLQNPHMMEYASKTDPAFYRKDGYIYIEPTPTSSQQGAVQYVQYPDVTGSASTISSFPDDLEPYVMQYAVIQAFTRAESYLRQNVETEITNVDGYLTNYENAVPTYGTPTAPTMPTLTLSSLGTLPTVPTLGGITIAATLPTYTAPGTPSLSTLTVGATPQIGFDLSLTGTPSIPSLSLPGGTPDITLAYVAPGTPPTVTLSITATLPAYTSPTTFDWSATNINDALTKAQELIDTTGTINVQTRLLADDIEMSEGAVSAAANEVRRANGAIQNQLGQLQEFEAEMREKFQNFQGDADRYQRDLEKELGRVRGEVQKYTGDLQSSRDDLQEQIAQYQNDVQTWAQESQNAIEKWAQEAQIDLNEWSTQRQTEIQEYREKVRRYLEEYTISVDKEVREHLANTDQALREYQLDIQEAVQQYQADIQAYRAKAQTTIEKYATEKQLELEKFATETEQVFREYESQTSVELQEYQIKTNAELGEYQANIQEAAQSFQVQLSKARSYLEEAQTRVSVTDRYLGQSQGIQQTIQTRIEQWNQGVEQYIQAH